MKKEFILDKLIELSSGTSINMLDLCHKIGIYNPNSYDYHQIRTLADEYNIELNFTYASEKSIQYHKRLPDEKVFIENSTYTNQKLKRRLLNSNIKENKCEICGISEWQGKPISLQVHHINGIHNDNRLENLQILCPNCHSQTDNFTSKNKKQEKTHYKKKEKISENKGKIRIKKQKEKKNDKLEKKQKPKRNKKEWEEIKKQMWNISHPSKEELLNVFKEIKTFKGVGKKYGVSDNSIRKWFKHYNLPLNKKEIFNLS